jgi:hypothetical protein
MLYEAIRPYPWSFDSATLSFEVKVTTTRASDLTVEVKFAVVFSESKH